MAVGAGLVFGAGEACAQTAIPWWSVDSGGAMSRSNLLVVRGAIGQFDAGPVLAGSSSALRGGFWVIPGSCPADLDDGTGTGLPDGGVDVNDLIYFLHEFEEGSYAADRDDGSGAGVPDGGTDISDLLYFLQHLEQGC